MTASATPEAADALESFRRRASELSGGTSGDALYGRILAP